MNVGENKANEGGGVNSDKIFPPPSPSPQYNPEPTKRKVLTISFEGYANETFGKGDRLLLREAISDILGVDFSLVVIESVVFKKASRRHLASYSGDVEVSVAILTDIDENRLKSEVTPSRLREEGVARARGVEIAALSKPDGNRDEPNGNRDERRWYATRTFFIGIGCGASVIGGVFLSKLLKKKARDAKEDGAGEEKEPRLAREDSRNERCTKVFPCPPYLANT